MISQLNHISRLILAQSVGMWLAPPILVILVTVFSMFMWVKADLRSNLFQLEYDDPRDIASRDLKHKVDNMTARLAWFTTVTVFFLAALACVGVSGWVIRQMIHGWSLIIALTVVSLATIIFWLVRAKEYSGPSFLEKLLDRTSGAVVGHRVIGFLNGVAFVGVIFIVGATSSVIAGTGRAAEQISQQVDYLAVLLYAGGALLVTCVLEVNQLHRWSAVDVSEDARKHVHRAAAALALTVGVAFTLMLLAAFVPAFIVLRDRAALVHQSIGTSFRNTVNLAVVFSPLVVGLVSSFWNSLPTPSTQ
jgi:hypothetical protein